MKRKAIWFVKPTPEAANERARGTLMEHTGMRVIAITDSSIVGTMPVDQRTRQPIGLLHGGASVALAESLASTAANLVVNPETHYCVGLEINANHISAARDGEVRGESTPVHLGRSTQVWETRITQGDRLVCLSRMTLSVLARR